MEIPTHGGKIFIALLSEAVADVEEGDVLTFQFVEPPGDVKPKKAAKHAEAALKGKRMVDRFHR